MGNYFHCKTISKRNRAYVSLPAAVLKRYNKDELTTPRYRKPILKCLDSHNQEIILS